MFALRRRLRHVTWIALLAMLGLALAPTLSRAAASGSGLDPWAELCSAAGTRPSKPDPAAAMPDHCPLCGHATQAPLLPTAESPVPSVPDGAHHLPALFTFSPRPLFAWAAAQARAPPTAS